VDVVGSQTEAVIPWQFVLLRHPTHPPKVVSQWGAVGGHWPSLVQPVVQRCEPVLHIGSDAGHWAFEVQPPPAPSDAGPSDAGPSDAGPSDAGPSDAALSGGVTTSDMAPLSAPTPSGAAPSERTPESRPPSCGFVPESVLPPPPQATMAKKAPEITNVDVFLMVTLVRKS